MARSRRKTTVNQVSSPRWGATTKLVVALTFVAIVAGLLIRFQGILGPLLMAFMVAYLFQPAANFVHLRLHLSWRLAVALIYLLTILFLLGLLTLGGLGLIQQIQSLISFVQTSLTSLPALIEKFSGQAYQFGPFLFDFRHLDLTSLSQQALGLVQTLLGRTGQLLGTIASSAAQFLGWVFFILLASYFFLSESGGLRRRILQFDIPGYAEDFQRLGRELGHIWNAFLRGQVIIFLFTLLTYTVVMGILGVPYAIGIALLAGLSKFLPYVGSFVTWTTLALVSFFQSPTPFGLLPLSYTILVVALGILIDQTFDNYISPRIFAEALHVHPGMVLIAALLAANLMGLLGVVVAAPILATVTLLWRYTLRKMLDLDPWPESASHPPPVPASPIWIRLQGLWTKVSGFFKKST